MSIESAKFFVETVMMNAPVAEQYKGAKTADDIVKKAAEMGYSFSEQDLLEVTAQLSDSELEGVAGGKQVDVPMKCSLNSPSA